MSETPSVLRPDTSAGLAFRREIREAGEVGDLVLESGLLGKQNDCRLFLETEFSPSRKSSTLPIPQTSKPAQRRRRRRHKALKKPLKSRQAFTASQNRRRTRSESPRKHGQEPSKMHTIAADNNIVVPEWIENLNHYAEGFVEKFEAADEEEGFNGADYGNHEGGNLRISALQGEREGGPRDEVAEGRTRPRGFGREETLMMPLCGTELPSSSHPHLRVGTNEVSKHIIIPKERGNLEDLSEQDVSHLLDASEMPRRPTSRMEAKQLVMSLRRFRFKNLDEDYQDSHLDEERSFLRVVALELARQTSVACKERGNAIAEVWGRVDTLVERQARAAKKMRREISRLHNERHDIEEKSVSLRHDVAELQAIAEENGRQYVETKRLQTQETRAAGVLRAQLFDASSRHQIEMNSTQRQLDHTYNRLLRSERIREEMAQRLHAAEAELALIQGAGFERVMLSLRKTEFLALWHCVDDDQDGPKDKATLNRDQEVSVALRALRVVKRTRMCEMDAQRYVGIIEFMGVEEAAMAKCVFEASRSDWRTGFAKEFPQTFLTVNGFDEEVKTWRIFQFFQQFGEVCSITRDGLTPGWLIVEMKHREDALRALVLSHQRRLYDGTVLSVSFANDLGSIPIRPAEEFLEEMTEQTKHPDEYDQFLVEKDMIVVQTNSVVNERERFFASRKSTDATTTNAEAVTPTDSSSGGTTTTRGRRHSRRPSRRISRSESPTRIRMSRRDSRRRTSSRSGSVNNAATTRRASSAAAPPSRQWAGAAATAIPTLEEEEMAARHGANPAGAAAGVTLWKDVKESLETLEHLSASVHRNLAGNTAFEQLKSSAVSKEAAEVEVDVHNPASLVQQFDVIISRIRDIGHFGAPDENSTAELGAAAGMNAVAVIAQATHNEKQQLLQKIEELTEILTNKSTLVMELEQKLRRVLDKNNVKKKVIAADAPYLHEIETSRRNEEEEEIINADIMELRIALRRQRRRFYDAQENHRVEKEALMCQAKTERSCIADLQQQILLLKRADELAPLKAQLHRARQEISRLEQEGLLRRRGLEEAEQKLLNRVRELEEETNELRRAMAFSVDEKAEFEKNANAKVRELMLEERRKAKHTAARVRNMETQLEHARARFEALRNRMNVQIRIEAEKLNAKERNVRHCLEHDVQELQEKVRNLKQNNAKLGGGATGGGTAAAHRRRGSNAAEGAVTTAGTAVSAAASRRRRSSSANSRPRRMSILGTGSPEKLGGILNAMMEEKRMQYWTEDEHKAGAEHNDNDDDDERSRRNQERLAGIISFSDEESSVDDDDDGEDDGDGEDLSEVSKLEKKLSVAQKRINKISMKYQRLQKFEWEENQELVECKATIASLRADLIEEKRQHGIELLRVRQEHHVKKKKEASEMEKAQAMLKGLKNQIAHTGDYIEKTKPTDLQRKMVAMNEARAQTKAKSVKRKLQHEIHVPAPITPRKTRSPRHTAGADAKFAISVSMSKHKANDEERTELASSSIEKAKSAVSMNRMKSPRRTKKKGTVESKKQSQDASTTNLPLSTALSSSNQPQSHTDHGSVGANASLPAATSNAPQLSTTSSRAGTKRHRLHESHHTSMCNMCVCVSSSGPLVSTADTSRNSRPSSSAATSVRRPQAPGASPQSLQSLESEFEAARVVSKRSPPGAAVHVADGAATASAMRPRHRSAAHLDEDREDEESVLSSSLAIRFKDARSRFLNMMQDRRASRFVKPIVRISSIMESVRIMTHTHTHLHATAETHAF